jgi:hypothetical protein
VLPKLPVQAFFVVHFPDLQAGKNSIPNS